MDRGRGSEIISVPVGWYKIVKNCKLSWRRKIAKERMEIFWKEKWLPQEQCNFEADVVGNSARGRKGAWGRETEIIVGKHGS